MAFWAEKMKLSPAKLTLTYGYRRMEILGGFVNGVFLLCIAVFVLLQSISMFIRPGSEYSHLVPSGLASLHQDNVRHCLPAWTPAGSCLHVHPRSRTLVLNRRLSLRTQGCQLPEWRSSCSSQRLQLGL